MEVVRRFIDVATLHRSRLHLQAQSTAIAEQTVRAIEPLVTAGQAPQLEMGRAQTQLCLRARLAEQAANACSIGKCPNSIGEHVGQQYTAV